MEDLKIFSEPKFETPLKDLLELESRGRRAYLIGAGCGKCANLPLMSDLTTHVLTGLEKESTSKKVLDCIKKEFDGDGQPNIEDYMSAIVDHLSISQKKEARKSKVSTVSIDGCHFNSKDLTDSLVAIRQVISKVITEAGSKYDIHRQFINSVLGPLALGQQYRRPPVDFFILNYDTLLEDSLGIERRCYVDGFNGGHIGWWDPKCYLTDEVGSMFVEARIFKVHGSIDWTSDQSGSLPIRSRGSFGESLDKNVLIWPASTKYQEIQKDPYSQIISHFRISMMNSGSQGVLLILGYSFGDTHINHEIETCLFKSEKRLTVVIFTAENVPSGILSKWISTPEIKNQVLIYSNRGFYHGDKVVTSEIDLPWWKFEVFTRLIGSER